VGVSGIAGLPEVGGYDGKGILPLLVGEVGRDGLAGTGGAGVTTLGGVGLEAPAGVGVEPVAVVRGAGPAGTG